MRPRAAPCRACVPMASTSQASTAPRATPPILIALCAVRLLFMVVAKPLGAQLYERKKKKKKAKKKKKKKKKTSENKRFFFFFFFFDILQGECRYVGACAAPRVARPSSDQVSGCDSSLELESSGVHVLHRCRTGRLKRRRRHHDGRRPPLPCWTLVQCVRRRRCVPESHLVPARHLAATPIALWFRLGLRQFGSATCSAARPVKPPALPVGKTCVGYGRTGSCLASSQLRVRPTALTAIAVATSRAARMSPPTCSAAPLVLHRAIRCRQFRA
jgi:hypothetical protein